MPSLSDHVQTPVTKMILIGDPGSGKTGALASLANAGYNVRIMDFDNGLDILGNILRDPKSPYKPEAIKNVEFLQFTDPYKNVNGRPVPAKATAWVRAIKTLHEGWKDGERDLGPILSWTPQDVLVIDSLTLMCKAALNYVLSLNGALGGRVEQQHWYMAQQSIEGLLEMLYDVNVKCNVIVVSHIVYVGPDDGMQQGYPASLGKALSPKIGRYFNSVLMAKSAGTGNNVRHKLYTKTVGMVELKNSSPYKVPSEYPLETGLAQFFKDIRS